MQLSLFDHIGAAYAEAGSYRLRNDDLYRSVATKAGIADDELDSRVPIGHSGQKHSLVKRKLRWHQQTMKAMGLIERVDGERGLWQLTEAGKSKLTRIRSNVAMLAYSTDLGMAVWGNCEHVLSRLDAPIMLCVTSPPYPLRHPRLYGNPTEQEYVDFICRAMEPVVKRMAPEASLCLNISNDIFDSGLPSRSLYREKLVIALSERLGLSKMDEIIWHNPSKPPGPAQWASIQRKQLNTAWEPVYWFALNPKLVKADNRRVLEPHTEKHIKLMEAGGERRVQRHSDGAYTIREGSYSQITQGRIPRNVLKIGHSCADHRSLNKTLDSLGLPRHGAPMPMALVAFLIRFLTEVNDLVVDPFGGSGTVAKNAEDLGRPWLSIDCMLEYVRGSAERFRQSKGFWLNPYIESCANHVT